MKKTIEIIKNNLIAIIIILQPILDILSYLETKTLGSSHSWIIRILILGFIFVLTFFNSNSKHKLLLCISPFAFFYILHILNLYRINNLNIISDTKYFVLVFQMPVLVILLIDYIKSTNYNIKNIKKSIFTSLCIVLISLILSILTDSYEFTYEYVGITGWFSSANTQSMILCALAPWFLYMCSNSKKILFYLLGCISVFLVLYTNGTRACYYALIALSSMFVFALAFSKNEKNKIIKIILTFLIIIFSIVTYKFSSTFSKEFIAEDTTKQNKDEIKKILSNPELEDINFNEIDLSDNELILKILKTSYLYRDLMEIHGENTVVEYMKPYLSAYALSNNRLSKEINAKIEYFSSDLLTKVLGIGYSRIEKNSLDMENDLRAIFYYYGILGFSIYIIFILYFIFKAAISLFKDFSLIHNKEFITLVFLVLLLIAGGEYSGAFLRKPNANIYLSIYFVLLYFLLEKNFNYKKIINKNKITFLMLHCGYGGIETATINTANALSDFYNIELISFYNLKNNQSILLNNKINIKYLYNGEPNKEEFLNALKSKKLFLTFREGIKSIIILIKKKNLIKREIKKSDSFAIVSTRYDFSVLLNKYGNKNTIKIAQEHHHHNNNKKYIHILKNKYKNIDYLFALTQSLKNDYSVFLKNNKKTKIVVVPNMLVKNNSKHLSSDLKNKNIISIGRLHKDKKIIDLINIFAKANIPNSKLFIIGDGEERNKIESHINELSLNNVILTGFLNKEEQEKYLLNSSVFVMTSVSEGLPMVLLEAMDYGIPCIAYETASGIPDIIQNDKNGFIIKNRNEEEFITKLNLLLFDDKLKNEFSINCKKTSEKYYKENIIKKWLNILSN